MHRQSARVIRECIMRGEGGEALFLNGFGGLLFPRQIRLANYYALPCPFASDMSNSIYVDVVTRATHSFVISVFAGISLFSTATVASAY